MKRFFFVKDVHEIKVKTARSKSHEVTTSCYDLPKEIEKKHKDATIVVGMFFANRMPTSISTSDKTKFLTLSFMENRTKRTRLNLLKQ